jgi:hypothetical protein
MPAATPGLHSWQTPTPQLAPVAAPARTRKSPWRIVLGIAVVGAILVGITSWATAGNKTSSSGSSSSSTRTVLYEVEGTATSVDITFETPSGTSQGSNKKVPLANRDSGKRGISVTMDRGDFVYISAQNQGKTGTVTCKISVDGVLVSKVTSSGAYAIASCDGTAP